MKKNNITIVFVIGSIAVIGGLFYFGNKNRPAQLQPQSQTPADIDHNHNITANVSSASLNSFIGQPVPSFSLTDRDGKVYSTDNLRGKNVILFFNEGLMCYPACWNQIVAFAKDERFKNDDTVVLSIVVDPKEDWQQAINKMPELAQATVVFDGNSYVSKKFNVMSTQSSMHPGLYPGHNYVIIDKEGVVRYVFDDPQMGIRNDELALEIAKL